MRTLARKHKSTYSMLKLLTSVKSVGSLYSSNSYRCL